MTHNPTFTPRTTGAIDPVLKITAAIAGLWAAGIVGLALGGTFDIPAADPALPTLLAILTPVISFALALRLSARLRAAVLALDPVLLTELQAWRILGGAFLMVYAFGHLPGVFAWPAGLGDVAVGLAAPYMAWRLRTDPGFIGDRRFMLFNLFGLADFAVAVSLGVAARNPIPGLSEAVTTSAMGQLPLVLIPTLAVPAFILMHLIVLLQIHDRRG